MRGVGGGGNGRISKSWMNIKKGEAKTKTKKVEKKERKKKPKKVKKQFIIQNKFPSVFAGWLLFGGVLI